MSHGGIVTHASHAPAPTPPRLASLRVVRLLAAADASLARRGAPVDFCARVAG
jgi:hypothetical protein